MVPPTMTARGPVRTPGRHLSAAVPGPSCTTHTGMPPSRGVSKGVHTCVQASLVAPGRHGLVTVWSNPFWAALLSKSVSGEVLQAMQAAIA